MSGGSVRIAGEQLADLPPFRTATGERPLRGMARRIADRPRRQRARRDPALRQARGSLHRRRRGRPRPSRPDGLGGRRESTALPARPVTVARVRIPSLTYRARPACTRPSVPSAAAATGTSSSRTTAASSSTAIAEDDAHLLGRQRSGQGEREEDRHHHRARGEDHPAGPCEAADHRFVRIVGGVPLLLGASRAGRPCSPSRSRTPSRRRRPGPRRRGSPATGSRAATRGPRPGRSAWRRRRPRRSPSRFVRTPAAAIRGARSARSRSDEAEREHDADHERGPGVEARLEVVVLRHRAAEQRAAGSPARSRSIVFPTAGSDGSCRGQGRSPASGRPPPAGGRTLAIPRSRPASSATAAACALGATI